MMQILRKEFRSVAPSVVLLAAIWTICLALELGTSFPDMPDTDTEGDPVENLLLWLVLVAFMVASGQLAAEERVGTLRFLDALPLRRRKVFAGKMCAGFTVVAVAALIEVADEVARRATLATSLDPPLQAGHVAMMFTHTLVVTWAIYGVALVCSLAGKWYALTSAAVIWSSVWLRRTNWPWTTAIDPLGFLEEAFAAPPGPANWRSAALLAMIGGTAFSLAAAGFSRVSAWPDEGIARSRRRQALGAGATRVGPWLAAVIWIAGMVMLSGGDSSKSQHAERHPGGEYAFQRRQTRYYEFVYRATDAKAAKELIAAADSICEAVAATLTCAPLDIRIVADLGGEPREGVLGDAQWTKVRVPLQRDLNRESARAVLAHETAHVYIERLSRGAMARHWSSTRFAHEGIATYIEHQLYPGGLAELRLHAAIVALRDPAGFDLLTDNDRLVMERDDALVYPVGESFVRALVAVGGKEAPLRILQGMARRDARHDLEGAAWWYDAAQTAGIDLESVLARQDEMTSETAASESQVIAGIPRLTAVAEVRGGSIVLRASYDGAAPGVLMCRLLDEEGRRVFASSDAREILIPRRSIRGTRLRYSLGWSVPGVWGVLAERWETATLEADAGE